MGSSPSANISWRGASHQAAPRPADLLLESLLLKTFLLEKPLKSLLPERTNSARSTGMVVNTRPGAGYKGRVIASDGLCNMTTTVPVMPARVSDPHRAGRKKGLAVSRRAWRG
ncbi:hypothetical protein CHELA40_10416 [Chelatococcus asaccharovorans]|nr:hypothetical protein CHELA40_10416 [Chelatococcus asaccharovorans]CAH1686714.1 hypothetical protein CHELA17_65191 [Chelatococcus asaccharovorans]